MKRTKTCLVLAAVGMAIAPHALAESAQASGRASEMVSEMIGDGVARFHASADARDNRIPSFALESPRESIGRVPRGFDIRPVFSGPEGDWDGVVTIDIEPTTDVYGTGQAAGPLRRNGRVTEAWNFDAYGYQDDGD